MSDDVRKMAQDVQDRIRELAYHLWESAGRQHGLANDYWLKAEREVLNTMQRAAEAIMPSPSKPEAKKAAPAPKPAAPAPASKPAAPASAPKPAATAPAPKPAPKPAAPTPAPKPAAAAPAPKPAATAPAPKPAAPAPKPAASAPKPAAAGSGIEDIEGIGPAFAKKLATVGITSPAQLLEQCGSSKGRTTVAEKTGIALKRVLRWVNMADLMRIDGIDGNFAELLEATGVDTVKELRNRNAENLANAMVGVNSAKNLARSVPNAKVVAQWIAQAKTLDPKVTY